MLVIALIIFIIIVVCFFTIKTIKYSDKSSKSPKPIGEFTTTHKYRNDLKGNIMVVLNYPNYHESYPDSFVALLDDTGKLNNDDDLLFYNSKLKKRWIFNGVMPEDTVCYSRDNAIYGPAVDFSYDNFADFYFIDLSLVSKEVHEIRFIHAIYGNKWLNKRDNHQGFQIAILTISAEQIKSLTHDNIEKSIDKLVVSDGINNDLIDKVNFVSASLVRESNDTWTYCPIWEEFVNIEEYIGNLVRVS